MRKILLLISLISFVLVGIVEVSAQSKVIVLDPGHGVNADGTPGDGRTMCEIETNLAVALKLRDLIQNNCNDWTVYLTRTTNNPGSQKELTERTQLSNNKGANLFISVHCNATDPPGLGTGTETYWCATNAINSANDQSIAEKVQANMVSYGSWYDRTVKTTPCWYVLKNTFAPSALNEIGFCDNNDDLAKLENNAWRDQFAKAYLEAIKEYFGESPADLDVTALVTPIGGVPMTSFETITVTLHNNSNCAINFTDHNTEITVDVVEGLGPTNTQTFTNTLTSGTLAGGADMDIIITQSADFSSPGEYCIDVTINTLNKTASNLACIYSGTPSVPPIAKFDYTISGYTASFTDNSYPYPNTWNWSFSGGSPSTYSGKNPPVITYPGPGTYTVSLTVSNGQGTDTKTITITVNTTPPYFSVNCNVSTTQTSVGNNITFSANVSGGTPPYTYTFDFGDWTTSTIGPTYSTSLQQVQHSYSSQGIYYPYVEVMDLSSSSPTTCLMNTVTIEPLPDVQACFTSSAINTIVNFPIDFTDCSTGDPNSWTWDFNGGTPKTSEEQNPKGIKYNIPGTYDVVLHVNRDLQSFDSYYLTITITPAGECMDLILIGPGGRKHYPTLVAKDAKVQYTAQKELGNDCKDVNGNAVNPTATHLRWTEDKIFRNIYYDNELPDPPSGFPNGLGSTEIDFNNAIDVKLYAEVWDENQYPYGDKYEDLKPWKDKPEHDESGYTFYGSDMIEITVLNCSTQNDYDKCDRTYTGNRTIKGKNIQLAEPTWLNQNCKVTVKDGANVNFYACDKITINNHFHAERGSHVVFRTAYKGASSSGKKGNDYVTEKIDDTTQQNIPNDTMVAEITGENILKTYPNPTSGELKIDVRLNEKTNARISIYNVLNQEIAVIHDGTIEHKHYTLNFNNKDAGIYFIRLAGENVLLNEKIVLVK